MRPSGLAIAFGVGRVLFGVAMLAVPGQVTRAWVGAEDAPAVVLARCLGGRDIVLGAGLALAAGRGGAPRPWLAGGVLADTVDGIATLAAGDDIPRNGRIATTALAGGSALFGACLARAVD
jgi:hypothetical protein